MAKCSYKSEARGALRGCAYKKASEILRGGVFSYRQGVWVTPKMSTDATNTSSPLIFDL